MGVSDFRGKYGQRSWMSETQSALEAAKGAELTLWPRLLHLFFSFFFFFFFSFTGNDPTPKIKTPHAIAHSRTAVLTKSQSHGGPCRQKGHNDNHEPGSAPWRLADRRRSSSPACSAPASSFSVPPLFHPSLSLCLPPPPSPTPPPLLPSPSSPIAHINQISIVPREPTESLMKKRPPLIPACCVWPCETKQRRKWASFLPCFKTGRHTRSFEDLLLVKLFLQ